MRRGIRGSTIDRCGSEGKWLKTEIWSLNFYVSESSLKASIERMTRMTDSPSLWLDLYTHAQAEQTAKEA